MNESLKIYERYYYYGKQAQFLKLIRTTCQDKTGLEEENKNIHSRIMPVLRKRIDQLILDCGCDRKNQLAVVIVKKKREGHVAL